MPDLHENTPQNSQQTGEQMQQQLAQQSQEEEIIIQSDEDIPAQTLQRDVIEYMEMEYDVYPGTEMINYDFAADRRNSRSTNLVESTAHLIKGSIGIGILGMHEAYMYGGLWTSLAFNILIAIIISYTMHMLVESAQKMYVKLRVPRLSYPDLAEVALATGPLKCCRRYSKLFRYSVDMFLLIEMCGSCCIYEIMIATTVKQAIEATSATAHNMNLSIRIYILIILLPLLVLCMIRRLKFLAPFSLAADFFIGICVVMTMYYSISDAEDITKRPAWKSVQGLFRFCGMCIYAMEGIDVALPVENNMRSPHYFRIVMQYAMVLVTLFTVSIGFFGYWSWGEACTSPITMQMPLDAKTIVLQFLLSIMLSVTFAIHFWVPFRIVWYYIGIRYKRHRVMWERFYRAIHVAAITCLSIAFPNLSNMMSFLGDFFVGFIGFIIPAFIESLVTWREHRKGYRWRFIKNMMIILLGFLLCFGAFLTNI